MMWNLRYRKKKIFFFSFYFRNSPRLRVAPLAFSELNQSGNSKAHVHVQPKAYLEIGVRPPMQQEGKTENKKREYCPRNHF